jgi:hypothetical protein
MYSCTLSVTDYSVVILDRKSGVWVKVFPSDYMGLVEFLLSARRQHTNPYVVGSNAVFWVSSDDRKVAITLLSFSPSTYVLSREDVMETVFVLCDAEEAWMKRDQGADND